MTASVFGEKSVSEKMHNFLPGRPSLIVACDHLEILVHNQQPRRCFIRLVEEFE